MIIEGVSDVHSGLTPNSVYYADINGDLTSSVVTSIRVGLAISPTEILLDGNRNNSNQFFGDLIFSNEFRITEAQGSPQGLLLYNQNNQQILSIDENGSVGIGTADSGAKLEVAGQIKITGGSPGAGKVLTSDDSGLAAWEAPAGEEGTLNTGKLCVGSVCVTEADFMRVFGPDVETPAKF